MCLCYKHIINTAFYDYFQLLVESFHGEKDIKLELCLHFLYVVLSIHENEWDVLFLENARVE